MSNVTWSNQALGWSTQLRKTFTVATGIEKGTPIVLRNACGEGAITVSSLLCRQPASDVSHKPNRRLLLGFVKPAVTFPASACYHLLPRPEPQCNCGTVGNETYTLWSTVLCHNNCDAEPQLVIPMTFSLHLVFPQVYYISTLMLNLSLTLSVTFFGRNSHNAEPQDSQRAKAD